MRGRAASSGLNFKLRHCQNSRSPSCSPSRQAGGRTCLQSPYRFTVRHGGGSSYPSLAAGASAGRLDWRAPCVKAYYKPFAWSAAPTSCEDVHCPRRRSQQRRCQVRSADARPGSESSGTRARPASGAAARSAPLTSAVERAHSALLGGYGLLVILGRVASRVCRMVPGKSSTGSFAVGKHHNRRCRCQQWAIRYSSRGTAPRSADR